MNSKSKAQLESYEQDCGLLRVQAVNQGEHMLDAIDALLGVADRHLERVRRGILPLAPMVQREIEMSIQEARVRLGVGR